MVDASSARADGPARVALVCVVDDDASVLHSLRTLLLSAGIWVEVFASAEAFLAAGRLDETGCLVLDLHMPGMSGQELFARIAQGDRKVPVIVLTARTDQYERDRMMRAGVHSWLTKPVPAASILRAIETALTASR